MTKTKKITNKGRPSSYTKAKGNAICKSLANGQSLRTICKRDGMPNKTTIQRWLRTNEDFRTQYARARDEQAQHYADEIIDIADDSTNDFMVNEHGVEVVDHEAIQRSKLRIDSRKWVASKLLPKKYGDRTKLVTDDGKGGDAAISPTVIEVPQNGRTNND